MNKEGTLLKKLWYCVSGGGGGGVIQDNLVLTTGLSYRKKLMFRALALRQSEC